MTNRSERETAALGFALEGAADGRPGFPIGDVAQIEAAWSQVNPRDAVYGFVVRLVDGDRYYLELFLDSTPARDDTIELIQLDETAGLPELGQESWLPDVSHLNKRLAELKLQ